MFLTVISAPSVIPAKAGIQSAEYFPALPSRPLGVGSREFADAPQGARWSALEHERSVYSSRCQVII